MKWFCQAVTGGKREIESLARAMSCTCGFGHIRLSIRFEPGYTALECISFQPFNLTEKPELCAMITAQCAPLCQIPFEEVREFARKIGALPPLGDA